MMLTLAIAALVQSAPDLPKNPVKSCVCEEGADEAALAFRGIVVDAQVIANASGSGVADRQATIFKIIRVEKGEAESPVKVWHEVKARCGVKFDYGKEYRVLVRKVEKQFETDACLVPDVAASGAQK